MCSRISVTVNTLNSIQCLVDRIFLTVRMIHGIYAACQPKKNQLQTLNSGFETKPQTFGQPHWALSASAGVPACAIAARPA